MGRKNKGSQSFNIEHDEFVSRFWKVETMENARGPEKKMHEGQ